MEDYIVLCGAEFLKRHASSLIKVLDTIIGNVNDKGLLSTLAIVDILVQVTSSFFLFISFFFGQMFSVTCSCMVL